MDGCIIQMHFKYRNQEVALENVDFDVPCDTRSHRSISRSALGRLHQNHFDHVVRKLC